MPSDLDSAVVPTRKQFALVPAVNLVPTPIVLVSTRYSAQQNDAIDFGVKTSQYFKCVQHFAELLQQHSAGGAYTVVHPKR